MILVGGSDVMIFQGENQAPKFSQSPRRPPLSRGLPWERIQNQAMRLIKFELLHCQFCFGSIKKRDPAMNSVHNEPIMNRFVVLP
jgi:hypothetical protein